ncbi:MAG: DNA-binding protein [Paracoccaceae bacterium]|nr:DNA-binding protein [Paracoccaceae bacterium]
MSDHDKYPVDDRGYTATPGAAGYTDTSESFLNKARHYGTGPEFVKFGKAVRYSFAALDAWAASQRRTSTKEPEAA